MRIHVTGCIRGTMIWPKIWRASINWGLIRRSSIDRLSLLWRRREARHRIRWSWLLLSWILPWRKLLTSLKRRLWLSGWFRLLASNNRGARGLFCDFFSIPWI